MGQETLIRISFFAGVLVVMAAWEALAPRRALLHRKALRWAANLGMVVLYTVLVRLVFPLMPVGLAALAAQMGFGLLNTVTVPYPVAVLAGVMALDFVIYLQHVMFHSVPALWRLHMMHHADLDFDVTTGLRFHPIEILLSIVIKLAAIAALGPPVLGVVAFEVLLNGTSMFNHGNVRLPLGLDRVLRMLVVTPDMHRVHHSVIINETNSNFGFNLPWWDRLLGTYRAQPAMGHEGMTIGLSHTRQPGDCLTLSGMLLMPFSTGPGLYPLGHKGKEPKEVTGQ